MEKVKPLPKHDPRLTTPLFTAMEVAQYVRIPPTTLRNWVRGYDYPIKRGLRHSEPIVRSLDAPGRQPRIPFIGLTEALVVSAFRRQGLPMTKIKTSLDAIEREIGVEHALANKSMYTAGERASCGTTPKRAKTRRSRSWWDPSSGQRVFTEPVRQYLKLITYDSDLWPQKVYLPGFALSKVVVDMRRGFGQPILERHRLRVQDITDRWYYGRDTIEEIAADLELNSNEVQDVIRVAWKPPSAAAA